MKSLCIFLVKALCLQGVEWDYTLQEKYVEELDGKISLISSLGNGSTFQVEIPLKG
ncbi:hypothetical protein [Rickettsiella massiliensis]|uniref:hypothetical protein n=1 Tax=Rickettsiella massiliensis TaxID=676517 RepID=UPI00029AE34F|nr:hypothetical protein [Rickettsiella massiliensis]